MATGKLKITHMVHLISLLDSCSLQDKLEDAYEKGDNMILEGPRVLQPLLSCGHNENFGNHGYLPAFPVFLLR